MSQFQPPPQQAFNPSPQPAAGGNGLAIGALVCAVLGFIVPLVGVVAIILAIIALVKPALPGRGKGLVIAALILAIVGTVFNCAGVMAGIMLPALGRASQSARQIKSSVQVRMVGEALMQYASDNQDWYPESPDGLDRLVASGMVGPEMLVTPHIDGQTATSYFYLPPTKPLTQHASPMQVVVVYENPQLVRGLVNVLFMDGHVEAMSASELNERLAAQGVHPVPFAPDGR